MSSSRWVMRFHQFMSGSAAFLLLGVIVREHSTMSDARGLFDMLLILVNLALCAYWTSELEK